jgi:hypothetical protein
MAIGRKPNASRHTIIDISILEDSRLSWTARGIYLYLSGYKDGEEVLLDHLLHAGPDEREEVEAALAELVAIGFITLDDEAASA